MQTFQKIAKIKIPDIRTDKGTQTRAFINRKIVEGYAERMRQGVKFSAIEVYQVGDELWLVDGFHRLEGTKLLGLDTIDCQISVGTRADAMKAAVAANQAHGLRRTNPGQTICSPPRSKGIPQPQQPMIAQMSGVSHEFVVSIALQVHAPIGIEFRGRRCPLAIPSNNPVLTGASHMSYDQ